MDSNETAAAGKKWTETFYLFEHSIMTLTPPPFDQNVPFIK
jgi:hypothetical protein